MLELSLEQVDLVGENLFSLQKRVEILSLARPLAKELVDFDALAPSLGYISVRAEVGLDFIKLIDQPENLVIFALLQVHFVLLHQEWILLADQQHVCVVVEHLEEVCEPVLADLVRREQEDLPGHVLFRMHL